MTIEIISGDLIEAFEKREVQHIAHCVNCQGVMGSGIAKTIKQNYPEIFDKYKLLCDKSDRGLLLGKAQGLYRSWPSDRRKIFNLFGQYNYGLDKRHGNYGAISIALLNMRNQVQEGDSVGFPYKMCSDRAGCDWEVIQEMIEFIFNDCEVKVYKLRLSK